MKIDMTGKGAHNVSAKEFGLTETRVGYQGLLHAKL